uniref:Nucleolar protein 11 n=1 Tax=Gouania willdenowi TaxID=441366 RepID=A0A8C5D797_GOUWI
MAALYEGYTLCAFVPQQNLSNSGIQGVEIERDSDHVLVTDSSRSVILYKVSDQKPLGSWTVKQGQSLTCSAVFNFQTSEYVAVSDNKVIRIWKEDDPLLDKAFKATVTSDIYRVLSIPSWEPVVLFQSGAVRLLDSLLSAPQQPIEDVKPDRGNFLFHCLSCLFLFFKDFLCIWNTNFQTLQAGKEMAGRIYGQLWSFSNKLLIPHGKTLSVIPFECPKSSLASALGKLKQTAPVEEVQEEVERFLSRSDIQGLQPSVGRIASTLVSRSLDDPAFYSSHTLTQLLNTQCLCHSVCPDLVLLALERKDYFLCQLCLQFFPDIPEAVTCVCLKAFISIPDVDAEKASLEPGSVSFMETVILKERGVVSLQNGFSPTSVEDFSDGMSGSKSRTEVDETTFNQPGLKCPVGSHKAALLNEILQTAYSDTFLLPHLKDLSSQHAILFLQYLHFLYVKCSQDHLLQVHGFRSPSLSQIMDWVCLLLDAHFTVLVMTPEAKGLLLSLHRFVKSQVKLVSELGKIEGSLQELDKMKTKRDIGQYSIEVIELL